jgi:hypothetical protein
MLRNVGDVYCHSGDTGRHITKSWSTTHISQTYITKRKQISSKILHNYQFECLESSMGYVVANKVDKELNAYNRIIKLLKAYYGL